MEVVLLFVGVLVGSIITLVVCRKKPERPAGTLWIDETDSSNRPDIFLELSKEVSYISGKKHVMLDINVVKRNSQK